MKVDSIAKALNIENLTGISSDTEVAGCYVGDLLSWAMAKLSENNVWITVMGNVNAVAVAKLTDAACIILCDNAPLDEEAKNQAVRNNLPIYKSGLDAYTLAVSFYNLTKQP